jgi:nitrate reductase beta subunit
MSKSKLKPEDIFFDLKKTIGETDQKETSSQTKQTAATTETKTESTATTESKTTSNSTAASETSTSSTSEKMFQLNVPIKYEQRYMISTIVNETKMRGIDSKYSIKAFVREAIEEKLEKTKQELNL